ncbi:hypothetical protein B0H13DRAFT_1872887 [Mycena leptocephala]|nr:hypothetical protein B0H13DRAFT_1872887 [Mycena leptocephala]
MALHLLIALRLTLLLLLVDMVQDSLNNKSGRVKDRNSDLEFQGSPRDPLTWVDIVQGTLDIVFWLNLWRGASTSRLRCERRSYDFGRSLDTKNMTLYCWDTRAGSVARSSQYVWLQLNPGSENPGK